MSKDPPNPTPGHEEALFAAALAAPLAERPAFLAGACFGDVALRRRLDALLAAHEGTGGILAADSMPEELTPTLELPEPVADEAVGQTLGRYKLLERVGEGGCGVVYVAEQTEPVRRRVALKVIKLGMDTKQVVARFEAERQALALMDHPNIAKVLDAGTTEPQGVGTRDEGQETKSPRLASTPSPLSPASGRPYFVMELVRGIKITDYCDQANLTTKDRLNLFIKVCQAIQHAHQKGIIHRDIKPSNILVTLHDGVPVPKVIDFGIAKATEGRLTDATVYTQLHQFIGTPAYMSPEQAEMSGLDIDTRSDIYSLGVLLYELLTGSTPFDGKELMSRGIDAMRKTIREQEPQRPSTRLATLGADQLTTTAKRRSADTSKLLHQLRGDLDWIVMKCLEKDRQRRYESANGLAADIRRHLENEPVVARPPSAAYKFQKALRRNKLVFAAGSAVVIALVAGLCLAALGWRQTGIERDSALRARAGEEAQRKTAQASEQRAVEASRLALAREREARCRAYVADMALVHQAADRGNLARAKDLLNRYRPKPGEDDIRGFEWRYLWAQARSDETARLGEYSQYVAGLTLSPDGTFLAHLSARGIEIRSFKSRALILTLTNSFTSGIQFSPDSQHLLTPREGGLDLWNTRTWQKETELPGAAWPIAMVGDGKVIVARHDDHLALWNLRDSRKVADLPGTDLFGLINGMRLSPPMAVSRDGHRLFLGGIDPIRVWDLESQTELATIPLANRRQQTFSLAASPEGLLAVGLGGGQVMLWDSETRQWLHTFEDHRAYVLCAAFSADGSRLATAGVDQNIFLYETRSRKLLRRFKGHEGAIDAIQFSGDGRWLVSGSHQDQSLRVWEVIDRAGSEASIASTRLLGFTDSNRSLVGWTADGYARMDVKTGATRPLSIATAQATNSDDETLWSVSPDGTRGALLTENGQSLRIRNLAAGTPDLVLLTNAPGHIRVALFSDDGKRLAASGTGWKTRVWNTADWSYKTLEDAVSTNIGRLTFSLNGSRLAQLNRYGVEVLDLDSGRRLLRVPESFPQSLALSPDGTLLAVGTQGGPIQLWNVDRGELMGTLRGHLMVVIGLAFSADGKTLASSGDTQLKLWNVETQQEFMTFAGLGDRMPELYFASDGSALATRLASGRGAQLWQAPSFEEITAAEAREKAEALLP